MILGSIKLGAHHKCVPPLVWPSQTSLPSGPYQQPCPRVQIQDAGIQKVVYIVIIKLQCVMFEGMRDWKMIMQAPESAGQEAT